MSIKLILCLVSKENSITQNLYEWQGHSQILDAIIVITDKNIEIDLAFRLHKEIEIKVYKETNLHSSFLLFSYAQTFVQEKSEILKEHLLKLNLNEKIYNHIIEYVNEWKLETSYVLLQTIDTKYIFKEKEKNWKKKLNQLFIELK